MSDWVLVVDDDTSNLKMASHILGKAQMRVSCLKSGEAAVKFLQENRPDLILLDIHMPGMDGFETITAIRENEATADIPVIFLTADDDGDTEKRGLEVGAADFIKKPFVPEVLLLRVRHTIDLNRLQADLEHEVQKKTKELEAVILQAISAIANTIDAKDEYTKGHSNRVAQYVKIFAAKIGKDENYINNLEYMALLHDIGKIGVPDSVLNKAGALTDAEFELIKQHTVIGEEILKDIKMVDGVAYGAKYHHERYDGTGYPQGLHGEEIPYEARIIGIADAYDAMTSNRVYRKKLSMETVIGELEKGRGKQFDPEMVDVFIELVKSGEMKIGERETEIERTLAAESNQLLMNIITRKQEQESDYDYLTGLYNRKAVERKIEEYLTDGTGVLMIVDLDYFKNVNDTYGHLMGDYALKLAAACMKEAVEEDSIVGRQGGDEFIIFLKNCTTKENAVACANKVREHFLEKTKEDTVTRDCSFSIGISSPASKKVGYSEMFAQADKALYHVKQTGRNNVYMYDKSDHFVTDDSTIKKDIEQIANIFRNSEKHSGAFLVKTQEINRIYEFTKSIANRYRYGLNVVLFTMENRADANSLDELEGAMRMLQTAIQQSLRSVDISTRYGSSQIIVVLLDADDNGVQVAVNKILKNYYKMQPNSQMDVLYDYVNLDEDTDYPLREK